tara:strand:+ start:501 stop:1289 length:789 start_codon:yes stop_codon:yes gene_type:complete
MHKIRSFKGFNWIGFVTLYKKEVQRFFNVFAQTILAPAVTTILFYLILTLSIDRDFLVNNNYSYSEFLAPGLICMSIMQNSFANTSSSILISKVQGNIVDVLMPPMSELELTFSYSLGGITRGVLVGVSVFVLINAFIPVKIYSLFLVIFFALTSASLLSLLGILCGIWAKKFDHMASITNFVILPLTFLSGTFYTIDRLPDFWKFLANWNPFFYIIDGFRYGFLGQGESNLLLGCGIMLVSNVFFIILTIYIFKKGYGLRS